MMRASSRTLDAQDPLDVLARASPPRALWSDGETTVIHEGVAARIEAAGPRRAQAVQHALPEVRHDGPGPGPIWLGGLAFEADHEGSGPWAGFPSACFVLGKHQVAHHDGAWTETTIDAQGSMADDGADGVDGMIPSARPQWDAGVEAAMHAIHDGHIAKVVLARAVRRGPGDAVETLRRLRRREPEGTMFFFEPSTGHAFLGTTPERLVRLRGGQVATHALAGSTGRGHAVEDDARMARALQESQKDVLEHELVAAFLRERLAEAGVKDIRQERRRVLTLGSVQHLETPIVAKATGRHILELVAALHPTPAVCGTPRRRSLDLIHRVEAFDRGWYAGAVGWFTADGDGDFSVALRCALCLPEARFLFAGAGIVAGSAADDEWNETETKLQSLEAAL